MTLTPQRGTDAESASDAGTTGARDATDPAPGARSTRAKVGAQPWMMGLAVAIAIAGAALGLNGVLRGWAWYSPVLTVVFTVSLTIAGLRALRWRTVFVELGGLASFVLILTFTFFRPQSIIGFIPSGATLSQLGRYLRRASETVLAESSPVAPNAGIVLLICAVLGLLVILVDALAVPLSLPATSGIGILAILIVPAMVKPQSVGVLGFAGAAIGYLMILGCSHWFAPDPRTGADTARNPGQFKRAVVTGALALSVSMLLQLLIPGFDQGTFPQGSRLNPFGSATGLNPMISLGNSLRSPSGDGRITFATNAPTTPYLRSVTVDSFNGDTWAPDDREDTRRQGTGRIDSGLESAATELRVVTAINTGQFTSPYLPAPYAPEAVNGLAGRWSWDPATLSIKGVDTNSRNQQYLVLSVAPQLTPDLLAQSSAPVQGVPEQFIRPPDNVPEIVRKTADSVTAGSTSAYAKAMAIQRFLRSVTFSYSLQSPVQGGYDGNGLSVLADFLTQKSGYCIHFASAMAVMARLEGVPSRIAVGYAPGRPTGATVSIAGQGALPEFEVDARDAHAWPELYFQGVGWVPFEPTPSRGVVPSYATEGAAPSGASTNENNDGLIPSRAPNPTPLPGAAPLPLPGAAGQASPATQLLPVLYGTGAVLLLALLVASPQLARGRLRRRRLNSARASDGVPPALPAWAELRDLATDYGVAPHPSETPRHFSERLRASAALGGPDRLDGAGHGAVSALTRDFERRQYGRPDAGDGTEGAAGRPDGRTAAVRIAAVQASLRANARPFARVRATWLPPSVLSRWRLASLAPFRALSRRAQLTRRGVAGSWTRLRAGLRRVRRG
ncbi:Protein-glutamine gamma-glutamyltransferase [Arthrobacter sp. SO5]|uniref:transglutaminaseTgpA domain-containing protein n=1 Tax=Arthrobacter sp. SO5 TaxID=1897055 RepID=UPI001E5F30E2|nr:transglutaminaseTgpA domain-containing protein [Arthrobacter sp. SO5]MCB5272762.1 Protein-glutamine gamma-glutamyltransferase [Arthrobacter sp. SO5]